MKRAVAPILLLLLLGCTPSPPGGATSPTAPPSADARTSAPSPSVSAAEQCYNSDHQRVLRGLADSWATIIGSRGESGQPELVQSLFDRAKKFVDRLDEVCDGDVDVAGTAFVFELSLLNVPVEVKGDAEALDYQKVADAGNELSRVINAGASFIPPD